MIFILYVGGTLLGAGAGELTGLVYGIFNSHKTEKILKKYELTNVLDPVNYAIRKSYIDGCADAGRIVGASGGILCVFLSSF